MAPRSLLQITSGGPRSGQAGNTTDGACLRGTVATVAAAVTKGATSTCWDGAGAA